MEILKPKTYNLKNRAGQSLVEIVIGLAISALLVGGAVLAITSLLRSNLTIQRGQSASLLAQDIMDRIRSFVAADWQNIYSLTKGTSTQYWLNASGSTFIAIQGKEGLIDNDVTSGLVAHWKFDEYEGTTSTTTYDSSGNSNNGTLINGPTRASSTCKISNCLSFDGTDDYVNVPRSSSYETSNITITAWVFLNNTTANHELVRKQAAGGSGFDLRWENGAQVRFWVKAGGSWDNIEINRSKISAGNWHHIAAVYNTVTMKLFVDGVEEGSKIHSVGGNIQYDSADLHIGSGRPEDASYNMNGKIDEVRIYNRALSTDEVKQIYQSNIYTRYFSVENVCRTNDSSSTISSVTPCNSGDIEDPATQKVTVYTRWPEGKDLPRVAELTLIDYFTRWQNAVFYQTDWSGGGNFDGPVTDQSTNRYSTSSNIGAPPWGYLYIKDVGIHAPTDGLVAYWPFDEGVGTSTADASGNGNNGTLTNSSSWVAGKVGNALNFNSVSLTVPNSASLQITGSSTFVFLAKFKNPTGCSCSKNFFYKGSASTTPSEYRLRLDSGDLLGAYGVPSNKWGIFGTSFNGSSYIDWLVPQTNGLESDGSDWHLVTIIKPSSGSGSFYSDRANLEYSSGTNVTAVSSTNNLRIDAFNLGSPMVIDEFRIYNRALSGGEIKNIYDSIFNP
jgi:hypothetical protein